MVGNPTIRGVFCQQPYKPYVDSVLLSSYVIPVRQFTKKTAERSEQTLGCSTSPDSEDFRDMAL